MWNLGQFPDFVKIWYFVNNCLIQLESKKSFAHVWHVYNCDYLRHSSFRFTLIDFQLNRAYRFPFPILHFLRDSEVWIQGNSTLWPMGKMHPVVSP